MKNAAPHAATSEAPPVFTVSGPLRLPAAGAAVAALVSLIAALVGPWPTTSVIAAIIAGALVLLHILTEPDDPHRRSHLLVTFIPTHLQLVAAAGVLALGDDLPWSFWLFLLIIGLVVIAEIPTGALADLASPYAANIPDTSAHNAPRIAPAPAVVFNMCALVVSFAGAIAPNVTFLVLQGVFAIAAATTLLTAAADAALRIRARQRFMRGLTATLERIAPQFALHYDAPPGTAYQVGMWLPELERIGAPYVIIVRNARAFAEVAALTERPVIYRRHMADLDACLVPSLRAVFYTNNGIRNAHMTRYPQLTHIQLNHGDSDKAPSHNPMFRIYDLDFVAGQAAIDRFAANGVWMPDDMFRIVGRPQVRGIDIEQQPISSITAPTVLYAPTWEGFNADSRYSSLPWGEQIVTELLARGCHVVFRPHPYAYRTPALARVCAAILQLLAADTERTGRRHRYGAEAEQQMTITDCFNASDAMISDVSSVVVDYLYSEKPLAVVSTALPADQFAAEFPAARAAYILEPGGDALADRIDALLRDDDMPAIRRDYKKHYLGDIPDDEYFDRFVIEARRAIAAKPPHQQQALTRETVGKA